LSSSSDAVGIRARGVSLRSLASKLTIWRKVAIAARIEPQ
jgi:hypothetical protein